MVLDTEDRKALVPQALDGLVIQIEVRDLNVIRKLFAWLSTPKDMIDMAGKDCWSRMFSSLCVIRLDAVASISTSPMSSSSMEFLSIFKMSVVFAVISVEGSI